MIKVARVNGDRLSCYCPFHQDDNPSLSVDLAKNAAYCFAGCFSGSIIKLVSDCFHISFSDARKMLLKDQVFEFSNNGYKAEAGYLGYISPVDDLSGWDIELELPYLVDRGFLGSTIMIWEIAYNDNIRHIRIPIKDLHKNMVGYIYRTIDNVKPKYLYNKGFQKNATLFGVHLFKKHNGIVNLTEGALDCVWLWQSGFTNSLALLGVQNMLTGKQMDILKELEVEKVRLCLDNDEAGVESTERLKIQLGSGFKVISIDIPKSLGKDVQDLSKDALIKVLLSKGGSDANRITKY